MRRRLVAAALPVTAVTFAWASLESATRPLAFMAVAATPLLAVLPRTLCRRAVVSGAVLIGLTLVVAASAATALSDVVDRGLRDAYSVAPPFDATGHPDLHILVLFAAAVFGLAIAVTAGSRPFVAAAITTLGLVWPMTVQPGRNTVAMGALALLAALWPVVVSGMRDRHALVPGAFALVCVVVMAGVAAGAGAHPSTAGVDWEAWDPFSDPRAGHTVALVWDSNYGGIDFPAKKTTVLRIVAPRRALYWRATTLDTFAGDRWVEALYGTALSGATRKLPRDELLPAGASSRSRWVKQEIDVRALVDDHVIAAGQPMEIAAGSDEPIRYLSGGIMRAQRGLGQMRHYTVWSYAPRPTPFTLLRSPPAYPRALGRYLDVGRTIVPPFGAPGRAAVVSAVFHNDLYQQLWSYEKMWREAQRLTVRAHSPYEATIAIERWLRSDGGFSYDEHPPSPGGLPALAAFAGRTRRGYCQQFAGTMALMLRYLGIPARVAVGFTSGTWKNGTWTVTDHDAHAWVEAWFAGHGWLAFDPTPGRGTLSATYTNASDSAEAIRALGTGRFRGRGAQATFTPTRGAARVQQPHGAGARWSLIAPFAGLVAALFGLGITKSMWRYRRSATDDPRRQASAARAELAAFIRDQGLPIAGTASVAELVGALRSLGVGTDAFAAAFSRARYGPPAGAAGAAQDTRRELRRVRTILRSRLGPRRRIRGFLAVRSLRSG